MDRIALSRFDGIAVAWVDGNHYLAVLGVHGDRSTIHDPNREKEEEIPTEELLKRSGGIMLMLSK